MTDPSFVGVVAKALEESAFPAALRESGWAYPAVESLHIIAFSLLVGSIVVVDLRLLGMRREVAFGPLVRLALPVSIVSAFLVVPSGIVLFVVHAGDLVSNTAFLYKLGLMTAAFLNAFFFHVGPCRLELDAPNGSLPRVSSRFFAMISIALWIAVLVAGRLIAYV